MIDVIYTKKYLIETLASPTALIETHYAKRRSKSDIQRRLEICGVCLLAFFLLHFSGLLFAISLKFLLPLLVPMFSLLLLSPFPKILHLWVLSFLEVMQILEMSVGAIAILKFGMIDI